MATGLPIIIPNCNDSFSTALHHCVEYDNGFEFRRGDAKELHKYLENLLSNSDLRRKMGERSSQLVKDKLNWSSITARTLSLYEETLKR